MDKSGYIYVLLNTSLKENLIKIGMTTRNPEDRVHELSSATGVPTPFILVYTEFFDDCYHAEKTIHLLLDEYRVSSNREFFEFPVYKAIKKIQELRTSLEESNEAVRVERNIQDDLDEDISTDLYQQAEEYYYGLGDQLLDYEEARKLYEKSSIMGNGNAHLRLGEIYERGQGVPTNYPKALNYYKEALKKGNNIANAKMALFFSQSNVDNSLKCWDRYFNNVLNQEVTNDDVFYLCEYLYERVNNGDSIKYISELTHHYDQILERLNDQIQYYQEEYPDLANKVIKVKKVVLNNFIVEADLINDFNGRFRELLGFNGNAVLFIEIISGEIKVGDRIKIKDRFKTKEAIVELIDVEGDFVQKAGSKDKEASLVLKNIPMKELTNLRSGAQIEIL